MSSTSPRKPAAERRAEIEVAAEAIARASGLSAITMRAVAGRVGIAPTLVVHHARSMDALVADAFERIVAAELAELVEVARVAQLAAVEALAEVEVLTAGPGRRQGTVLDAVLATVLDGSRTEVTLVWVESWVLGRSNAELAERVRAQMDAWRGFLAGLIEAGRAAGVYRVADPLAVAGQLLGMIDGLNAHSLVGWQDDDNRIGLMRRAVDAMLGVEAPAG